MTYSSIESPLSVFISLQSPEVTENELDTVLSSIDLELSIQRTNIALNNCQTYVHDQHRNPVFILQKKPMNKATTVHVASTSSAENSSDVRDIETEIDRLQQVVSGLQQEVDHKQTHFRNELQQVGARFKDAICIPPMGSKTSVIC